MKAGLDGQTDEIRPQTPALLSESRPIERGRRSTLASPDHHL